MKRLFFLFFAVFLCLFYRLSWAHQDKLVDIRFFDYEAFEKFYTEFSLLAEENHYTTPTDFYTGGFTDGHIPAVQDKNRTNVLFLGGIRDVNIQTLEDFDFIFTSLPDLSSFLDDFNIKSHYIPPFIDAQSPALSQCVLNPLNKGCYFLVIGHQLSVLSSIQSNGFSYKYIEEFKPDVQNEIISDLAHISGIIFNDTLRLENSNDFNPYLLYAVDYGIPVLMANPIAFIDQFNTKPLFRLAPLFADTFSHYSYGSDIDYFFMYPTYRLNKARSAQKILSYLYSTQTAARNVFQIITQNKPFVPKLPRTLNILLTVFPGIYNNGDYWIASDLSDALKNNYDDIFFSFPNSPLSELGDVFIYLRGGRRLHENLIKKDTVSLMYLFYSLTYNNQDIPSLDEYIQQFFSEFKNVDTVVTASNALAKTLKNYDVEAYYIPQFTNVKKFYFDYDENVKSDVLFVGNYTPYRQAVPTLLEADIPVSIYGDAWPDDIAQDRYIDNRILRKYYSSAKIVLNDTRADMRKLGFISNRIFDATACGTLVISDYMKEIEEVYGDSVPMWKTKEELVDLVKYYLAPEHEAERLDKAKRAREITLHNFTSDIAAEKFQTIIDDLKKRKGLK